MKTSNWWYAFFFVAGGIAMVAAQNVLFVKATGQQPPVAENQLLEPTPNVNSDGGVAEVREDGTIVTRLKDGRVLHTVKVPTTVIEERADGTVVQRSADGKMIQAISGRMPQPGGADGIHFAYGIAADPETTKLMQEEMAAAQATQKLTADFRAAQSDGDKERLKTELRENLTAVFGLQQKRRAHEIEQIQTRLKKLQETMSKRDAAKKEIVDRRVEVLTGGIDELGWEDTLRYGPNATTIQRVPNVVPYPVPGANVPLTAPPAVGPLGAGVFPSPVPVLPAPSIPGLPGVAPAAEPNALPPSTTPAPAAPRR